MAPDESGRGSRSGTASRVSRSSSRASSNRPDPSETRRVKRTPPGRSSTALREWLPPETRALCGVEQPLFLALDKVEEMVANVKAEGLEAQKRVLKRLETSLLVRARRAGRLAAGGAAP